MRPPKVETDVLLDRLMDVLKSKGYEGASLNDLANASGLQKASLYHRFPGGKKEIVLAVLDHCDRWLERNVFGVLKDKSLNPKTRLTRALANTRSFYEDGDAVCIIRALGLGTGIEIFGKQLKGSIEKWLDSLITVALDIGLDKGEAEKIAMNSLINIQGSLVISKAMDSPQPFLSAMKDVESFFNKK